jgi:predicted nucleotidyltransferase
MIFTETDIISKAWLTTEIVNLALMHEHRLVDKIFLIGSYASGTQNNRSDIDFLIQLKGGMRPGLYYVTWEQQQELQRKLGPRIHIIFGTEISAQRLHEKHKNDPKTYVYREISQGRIVYANTHRTLLPQ